MAENLSRKQILKYSPVEYASIRDTLRTGDLIFCSGNYLFSRIIQKFTQSLWSHVGIVYYDQALGRMLILESEKLYGVRLAPLSKYVKDYHGKNKPYRGLIVVGRVEPALTFDQLKSGISFGMDELTKPYDNWEIVRIAFRILFRTGRRVNDRKYICSELVQTCFSKSGVDFPYQNKSISPDDIWKDNRLMMKYRLL